MHAMGGVIDIRRFGGLRDRLPVTHATFLFGCLALAGVVPLAGFWSKDAILLALRERAAEGLLPAVYHALYLLALLTAALTAFYTFRAFFLTFYGPEEIPAEAGEHAQESPRSMTVPLVILAIGTFGVGMLLEWVWPLEHFLAGSPSLAPLGAAAASGSCFLGRQAGRGRLGHAGGCLAGIAAAWVLYLGAARYLVPVVRLMRASGLYALSAGKFFFDRVYRLAVVRPLEIAAGLLAWADQKLVMAWWTCGADSGGLGGVLRSLQERVGPVLRVGDGIGVVGAVRGAVYVGEKSYQLSAFSDRNGKRYCRQPSS